MFHLEIHLIYDKLRNRISKKPYSTDKVKLNFGSPTLLDGWDKNKEPENLSIILRKGGKYYLGIINKQENQIFVNVDSQNENDCFQKIVYKQVPGPDKMFPKVFFSKKNIGYYSPSKEILKIRETKQYASGNQFNKNSLHKFIDFTYKI